MTRTLRVGIVGAGYWARFQVAAWREVSGVEIVGVTNRTRDRAERLAQEFDVSLVAPSAEALIAEAHPDVLDVITGGDTHRPLAELSLRLGVPVICQKPLADSLEDAERMVAAAAASTAPLLVHENFRWQAPIRGLKRVLQSGAIGSPFRARISFCSAFPVFENQPFLRDLDRFLLMDIGTHILDVARFLFGDASSVYCRTSRANPSIKGEDVATVVLEQPGMTTVCEMSYATRLERELFPQTLVVVEGSEGSVILEPDYVLRVTTPEGTTIEPHPPARYAWADPAYEVVHSSIVDCNAHMRSVLMDRTDPETSGADNLRTLRVVFAAYDSAESGEVIRL